jgi:hypothetical protein
MVRLNRTRSDYQLEEYIQRRRDGLLEPGQQTVTVPGQNGDPRTQFKDVRTDKLRRYGNDGHEVVDRQGRVYLQTVHEALPGDKHLAEVLDDADEHLRSMGNVNIDDARRELGRTKYNGNLALYLTHFRWQVLISAYMVEQHEETIARHDEQISILQRVQSALAKQQSIMGIVFVGVLLLYFITTMMNIPSANFTSIISSFNVSDIMIPFGIPSASILSIVLNFNVSNMMDMVLSPPIDSGNLSFVRFDGKSTNVSFTKRYSIVTAKHYFGFTNTSYYPAFRNHSTYPGQFRQMTTTAQ